MIFKKMEVKKKRLVLLPETKIGEHLSIGSQLTDDEVGLFIASADVSASVGFTYEEFIKFAGAIEEIYKRFSKIFKEDKK